MNYQVHQIDADTKAELERVAASGDALTNSMRSVMEEHVDFSKRTWERADTFFGKLKHETSLQGVIRLQTEFVQTQTSDFFGRMGRIGQIYQQMSLEAFKPLGSLLAQSHDAGMHP